MRLIKESEFSGSVISKVALLRSKGVLATNASEYANIPKYGAAAKNVGAGIWIHIEQQYDDALRLLANENHVVKTVLTESEMHEIEREAKKKFFAASAKMFSKLGVVFVYILMFCVLSFVVFKALNS